VLAAALASTACAAPGVLRLEMRTDGHALVPAADPAVLTDAAIRAEFGFRDPLVVLVRSGAPEGIYDPSALQLIDELTRALRALPGVDSASVRSLATEPSDRFLPGTLRRKLLLEPVPANSDEIAELRADIEANGLFTGTLLSEDGTRAAILAGVEPAADRTALVLAAQAAVALAERPPHEVSVLGAPAAEALLGTHILEDLGVRRGPSSEKSRLPVGLLPLAIATMAIVFLATFRRPAAALLPLAEAGACLVFVFGVMGWVGVPVYLTMAVLPVILVSMGLADEIHVFAAFRRRRSESPGESIHESVRGAFDEMSLPILATGLTTCVGFLAFAISPLAPVRAFGLFTALGLLFCMLWTLTAIPALLVLIPERALLDRRASAHSSAGVKPRWVRAILRSGRRPALSLAIAAVLFVLSLAAALGVQVQDSWNAGFARESAFSRATRDFDEHFFGAHRLLLAIDTGTFEHSGLISETRVDLDEIAIPGAGIPDPSVVVGCSLAVSVRPDSAPAGASSSRPLLWTSHVETVERRGDELVLRTPPVHGSPRFLLRPAPAETLRFDLRAQRLTTLPVLDALAELEEFVRAKRAWAVGGVLGPPDYIETAEFLVSDRAGGSRAISRDPDRVRWLWRSFGRLVGEARLREIVDPGLNRGLVTIFLKDANYADTEQLMAALRGFERERLAPERIRFDFAGDVAVSQALIEAIVRSQVGSLLASLLGIALVSAVIFRSLRWGMICMVPAALAVAATFAALGLTGTPLGVATSMFASMVLGIGVDFAIHLVQRYRFETSRGAPPEAAVSGAFVAVGPSILVNAVAITAGFGILLFSKVPANAQLGGITVVSLGACFVATCLVIPALVLAATPRTKSPRVESSAPH
jgi:predicted RND superfamily exporter protein